MSSSEHGLPLLFIEGGLTAIFMGLSFVFPRLGSAWFTHIERWFSRLARRKHLAVTSVGLSALLLRWAILPFFPIPLPFIPNDFSFLLAADTFAHGRLANPTPAMWTHFEAIHVTMHPTYMSMFFPGFSLVLAAGQVLFGNPWFASLCLDALMCAAICWALQAWLPPGWALLGGFLAVLRLGLFSYWINSVSGGNALLTALGGALMVGGFTRFMKSPRSSYALLMAVGTVIFALTRPYEGLLLSLPVAILLIHWMLRRKPPLSIAVLLRKSAIPLALLFAALAWLGYYDCRAFGSPTTLPYTVDRAQYGIAPYFIWQSPRPQPHYRHELMRSFYAQSELKGYEAVHSLSGFIPATLLKALRAILFFAGFALLPALVMVRRILLDRRVRPLLVCISFLLAGILAGASFATYYLAPFTVVIYALGLQAMRHLRLWASDRSPIGKTMVRLSITVCVLMVPMELLARPVHFQAIWHPDQQQLASAGGPVQAGSERAEIESRLASLPGKQLVFVRYLPSHNPIDDWIYNAADINSSKVIWAWDMGPASNLKLLDHYRNRKAWLVEPDTKPVTLIPYPAHGDKSTLRPATPGSRS